jgi:hypothetical protein
MEKQPIVKELEAAQAWLDGGVDGWAGPEIVKRLMMVIRFMLADIEKLEESHWLENGWDEK